MKLVEVARLDHPSNKQPRLSATSSPSRTLAPTKSGTPSILSHLRFSETITCKLQQPLPRSAGLALLTSCPKSSTTSLSIASHSYSTCCSSIRNRMRVEMREHLP